jgi:perosamine synthetase
LQSRGIGCNRYFTPIHLQPFYQEQFGYRSGDFPVTERVADRTLALPFYNRLTQEDIEIVCQTLANALDSVHRVAVQGARAI